MMPIECSRKRLQQRFLRQDAPELNPKSEARNTKQYQNFKLIMFKTFDKRSGISCKNEKPRPGDKPVDSFVLDFGNLKSFRISDFEFRICNWIYLWRPLWFDHAHHPEPVEGRFSKDANRKKEFWWRSRCPVLR